VLLGKRLKADETPADQKSFSEILETRHKGKQEVSAVA